MLIVGNRSDLNRRFCCKPVLWCDLHSVGGGLDFRFLNISETFDSRDAMYLTREEAIKLR